MKSFTYPICYKQIRTLAASTVFILLFSASANAQFRPYTLAYSDNIQGTTTMIGNTVEAIDSGTGVHGVDTTKMNNTRANGNSTYGNNSSNMQFVNIDATTANRPGMFNSSSADLSLPAGTNTIKFARLYWGGLIARSTDTVTNLASDSVKLTFGNQSYYKVVANHVDDTLYGSGTSAYYQYQCYSDITQFVQTNGSGTYFVGNIPTTTATQLNGSLSTGANSSIGAYGGWCIVIAYENPTAFTNYNSIRIYDGYQLVYNGGSSTLTTVTLSGLNVPSGTLTKDDAKMGMLTWEGDASLTGDSLRINNNYFSNALNPLNNVFNGSITDSGTWVHSKNPDYNNEMALDIDQFYVGTGFGINPGAQTVTLAFRTSQDQYLPGLFTFVIKTNPPNPSLNKTVTDSTGSHIVKAGDLLTYDLTGNNTGIGNANKTVITDTLPNTMTYVPGSLKVIYSPGITAGSKTDASGDDQAEYISSGGINSVVFRIGTGATGSTGGVLVANDSFHVQFKVRVNSPSSGATLPPIVNIAQVIAFSDASVESIDFGTAIIDPQGGPLPVTLTNFSVALSQSNEATIDWTTSLENNCTQYYVQRSTDGKTFNMVTTVAGHGTTTLAHSYSTIDDLAAITASVVYYRLVQVDANGNENYSRVVAVKLKAGNAGFTVSPNPFSSYVNLGFESSRSEIGTVKVFNIIGKEVIVKNIQLSKGTNYISIDELSTLPSGNYLLQLNSSDGSTTKKVTKQ